MRIGLIVGLNGDNADRPAPSWAEIEAQVRAAEGAGFDLAVFEDAMFFGDVGMWESMAMAGAMAAMTETIGLSHSVVNAPSRHAALIAKSAETLDEISGGRYLLGIGAGNTPEDYESFDIPADPRYSRFADSIRIIHGLLKNRYVDYEGRFQTAKDTSFYPIGPRSEGPPIVIAAAGPRMLRLCAEYGDGWNWWGAATQRSDHLEAIVEELAVACEELGRDPADLDRSVDIYSIDPLGVFEGDRPDHLLAGSKEQIVDRLLSLGEFGVDEVRVDLAGPPARRAEAASAMAEVVAAVQAG